MSALCNNDLPVCLLRRQFDHNPSEISLSYPTGDILLPDKHFL